VDFVKEMIARTSDAPSLSNEPDTAFIRQQLAELGSQGASLEAYSRISDQLLVSYNLLREGKMPESQSLIGRFLNEMLTSPEDVEPRKQRLDGTHMPPFDEVEQGLGNVGAFLKAEKDGWWVVGVALRRSPEEPAKIATPAKSSQRLEIQPDGDLPSVETAAAPRDANEN
jgi:hypothetical protein